MPLWWWWRWWRCGWSWWWRCLIVRGLICWEPIFIGTNKETTSDERQLFFQMTMMIIEMVMIGTSLDDAFCILQVQGLKLCLMRYHSLLSSFPFNMTATLIFLIFMSYNKRCPWYQMNSAWNDISLRYEFHVLDNAFLVHSPGVKTAEERDRGRKPAKANI